MICQAKVKEKIYYRSALGPQGGEPEFKLTDCQNEAKHATRCGAFCELHYQEFKALEVHTHVGDTER